MFLSACLESLSIFSIVPFTAILSGNTDYPFLKYFNLFDLPPVLVAGVFFLSLSLFSNLTRIVCLKFILTSTCDIGSFISDLYFSNYVNQTFSQFLSEDNRDLPTVINKYLDATLNFISNIFQLILTSFQIAAICISILYLQSIYVFLFLLILPLFYLFFVLYFRPILDSNSKSLSRNLLQRQNIINQVTSGFKEIKIYNFVQPIVNSFRTYDSAVWKIDGKNLFYSAFPKYIVEPLGFTLIVLYLIFLSQNSIEASEIFVSLAVLILAFQKLIPYAQLAYNSWSKTKSNLAMVEYTTNTSLRLSKGSYKSEHHSLLPSNYFNNKKSFNYTNKLSDRFILSIDNISFSYLNNPPLLNSYSFKIDHNSNLFIYGESGCGKSTFLDIVCGLLEPDSGNVLLNSNHISKKSQSKWSDFFSYTTQSPYVFTNSILFNITFLSDKSLVDHEHLNDCLRVCCLTNFVDALPNGLNTFIGDGVQQISGGERQRLGLARALYQKKPILIADECTSGLNNDLSHKVVSSLVSFCSQQTLLFVTHDRSLVKYFNKTLDFCAKVNYK